jgi:hypothetical protein
MTPIDEMYDLNSEQKDLSLNRAIIIRTMIKIILLMDSIKKGKMTQLGRRRDMPAIRVENFRPVLEILYLHPNVFSWSFPMRMVDLRNNVHSQLTS